MAENVAATASPKPWLWVALRPHPGITILKSWKGIVEIVQRAIAVGLAFLLLITASVVQDDVEPYKAFDSSFDSLPSKTYSTAGWLLFVTIVAMLIEAAIIAIRFLNLGLIEKYILPLVITDAVISFVIAVCLFTGGTPMATYTVMWSSSKFIPFKIQRSTQAATVFSFFSMSIFTLLGTWVLIIHFALKQCTWDNCMLKLKRLTGQNEQSNFTIESQ